MTRTYPATRLSTPRLTRYDMWVGALLVAFLPVFCVGMVLLGNAIHDSGNSWVEPVMLEGEGE